MKRNRRPTDRLDTSPELQGPQLGTTRRKTEHDTVSSDSVASTDAHPQHLQLSLANPLSVLHERSLPMQFVVTQTQPPLEDGAAHSRGWAPFDLTAGANADPKQPATKKKRKWDSGEDDLLVTLVEDHGTKNWGRFTSQFSDRTGAIARGLRSAHGGGGGII